MALSGSEFRTATNRAGQKTISVTKSDISDDIVFMSPVIYKRDSFGLRNCVSFTKECSMIYRQSETLSLPPEDSLWMKHAVVVSF